MRRIRHIGVVIAMLLWLARGAMAVDTPAALDAALQGAAPGQSVALGLPTLSVFDALNRGAAALDNAGVGLIYSDDPETALHHGVLYRDELGGGHIISARLYIYHVNGLAAPAKITAVLENLGTASSTIFIQRRALPAPTVNYIFAGKTGVQQFYEGPHPTQQISGLAPGAAALLDPALDAQSVTTNQLVAGIYDVTSDQPLRATILMLPAAADTLATFATQPTAPNDGFNRQGTFPANARENATPYAWNTGQGIKFIEIASNPAYTTIDLPLAGTDAESGGDATLAGNYGVAYTIRLRVRSTDGRRLALLLKPGGGAYGGYLRMRFPSPGGAAVGQLVPSPALTEEDTAKGIVCGMFDLSGADQDLDIEIMPAGASSLPIRLLLVPVSQSIPPNGLYLR